MWYVCMYPCMQELSVCVISPTLDGRVDILAYARGKVKMCDFFEKFKKLLF